MNTPLWRIEMLGGLCARETNGVAPREITRFRTHKTGALLAFLAFYREGPPHPRELLIDQIWPDADRTGGRNSLSIALSSLRNQLEPPGVAAGTVIVADRSSVQLNALAVATDVAEFETLLRRAAAASEDRARLLGGAAALYRGGLLPAHYEDWVLAEQRRLEEQFLGAVHTLIALLQQSGDAENALLWARRAVQASPLREEAHHDLIRLLTDLGRFRAARDHYAALERALARDNDRPGAALRALARALERPALERPAAAADPPPSPLPPRAERPPLPAGTVSFLAIEAAFGGARGEGGAGAALRRALNKQGGQIVREANGTLLAAFAGASDALGGAAAARHLLPGRRMAVHTGDVPRKKRGDGGRALDYVCAMLAAAREAQTLVSEATAVLVRGGGVAEALGNGAKLTDLGVCRLRENADPERLFQLDLPGAAPDPPAGAPAPSAAGLPPVFTRFFGRAEERARLAALLRDPATRLVTVTGPGGTGKTRLARETAGELLGAGFAAIRFAGLADANAPERIAEIVAATLGLRTDPGVPLLDQIAPALAREPTLLVLDNFEQLVESGGPTIVETLLGRVSTLTCLVTSHRVLGLEAEQIFPLDPLPTPPPGARSPEALARSDSVQLFVDRAQKVRPDFQITANNARAVAALIEHLEGIPLAIELAAARAQVLSPARMLAEITERGRFELLTGRRRSATPRHQSLRAAIDWSGRLLAPDLARFWERLSVFRGGWSLAGAEAVAEEALALDYLAQLAECSLVVAEEDGSATRFRMLETLREYAEERLAGRADAEAARARHLRWCLDLAESAEPRLEGPEHEASLQILEQERENLRAALDWANARDPRAALVLAAALAPFWEVKGYWNEGDAALERAIAATSADPPSPLRSRALRRRGALLLHRGDFEGARCLLEDALRIGRQTGDRHSVAGALNLLGVLAEEQGDLDHARALHEEALVLHRETGEPLRIAASLNNLANIAYVRGDYDASWARHSEALVLQRAAGDRRDMAISLNNLGNVRDAQGDPAAARALYEEALTLARAIGDRAMIARNLGNIGVLTGYAGDWAGARALHAEALAIQRDLGDQRGVTIALNNLGVAANGVGDAAASRAYYEEALELLRQMNNRPGMATVLNNLGNLARDAVPRDAGDWARAHALYAESLLLRRNMGNKRGIASTRSNQGILLRTEGDLAGAEAAFAESLAIRRELEDREGIADALHNLGALALHRGDRDQAHALLTESLTLRREAGDDWPGIADSLQEFARLALAEADAPRGARLLGAAAALRQSRSLVLTPREQAEYDRLCDALRAACGAEVFARGLAEGRATDWKQAVADILGQ